MVPRFLGAIALLVPLSTTFGCGAPYKFIAHAEPNPFTRPGCRAVIEPLHVDHLVVGDKPVGQYVADKSAESADSFDNDVRASDGAFHQRIAEEHGSLFLPGAPDNTFLIRPVFTHWEPGYFAVFVSRPGVADLLVDVISPGGQLLDRIAVETKANASAFNASSGGRMREALKRAGAAVGVYISDNWLCAAQ